MLNEERNINSLPPFHKWKTTLKRSISGINIYQGNK